MTKILCIEDNLRNMRLVQKMLAGTPHTFLEASSGTTAKEMIATQEPDIILLDINLPDVDGTQIATWVKTTPELAHIPIIALTANAMHGDKERFLGGGCDAYIAKPITRRELLDTIRELLKPRDIDNPEHR